MKKRRAKHFSATPSHHCMKCGERYFRRDRIEVWTSRNPGHRMGWVKEVLNLCMRCSPKERAQRIVVMSTLTSTATKVIRNGKAKEIRPAA